MFALLLMGIEAMDIQLNSHCGLVAPKRNQDQKAKWLELFYLVNGCLFLVFIVMLLAS